MNKIYKVIGIADQSKIITDYGEKNGAVLDDIVLVYDDQISVIDPDTLAFLGYRKVTKCKLQILEVHPNFSICGKTTSFSSRIFRANNVEINNLDKLSVDLSQIDESENTVRIGDKIEVKIDF